MDTILKEMGTEQQHAQFNQYRINNKSEMIEGDLYEEESLNFQREENKETIYNCIDDDDFLNNLNDFNFCCGKDLSFSSKIVEIENSEEERIYLKQKSKLKLCHESITILRNCDKINLLYFKKGNTILKTICFNNNYGKFIKDTDEFKTKMEILRLELQKRHHKIYRKNNKIFVTNWIKHFLRFFRNQHLKTNELNLLIQKYAGFKMGRYAIQQLQNIILNLNLTPTYKTKGVYNATGCNRLGYFYQKEKREYSLGYNWDLNHQQFKGIYGE